MIYKTFQVRLYPNLKQERYLAKQFGCCRFVYNWGLSRHKDSYEKTGESPSWIDLCKELTQLRKQNYWLKEVSARPLQASIRQLDDAYQNFFKKVSNYPKFRKKRSRQSCNYSQDIALDVENRLIYFNKIRWIRYLDKRTFSGKIKSGSIVKTSSGKYYAYFITESNDKFPEKKKLDKSRAIGVDLGLTTFATFSDGRKIENPRFLKKKLKKLSKANRKFQRTVKGSNNREKSRLKLVKIYEKISNQRKDFLHKSTTKMINENQVDTWVVETLNIQEMSGLRILARGIHDASWWEFVRQLQYKSDWKGKNLIKIGQFLPSSKTCSCGVVNKNLTLGDRTWICLSCHATHDRDLLAAQNILKFGFSTEGNSGINASGDQRAKD